MICNPSVFSLVRATRPVAFISSSSLSNYEEQAKPGNKTAWGKSSTSTRPLDSPANAFAKKYDDNVKAIYSPTDKPLNRKKARAAKKLALQDPSAPDSSESDDSGNEELKSSILQTINSASSSPVNSVSASSGSLVSSPSILLGQTVESVSQPTSTILTASIPPDEPKEITVSRSMVAPAPLVPPKGPLWSSIPAPPTPPSGQIIVPPSIFSTCAWWYAVFWNPIKQDRYFGQCEKCYFVYYKDNRHHQCVEWTDASQVKHIRSQKASTKTFESIGRTLNFTLSASINQFIKNNRLKLHELIKLQAPVSLRVAYQNASIRDEWIDSWISSVSSLTSATFYNEKGQSKTLHVIPTLNDLPDELLLNCVRDCPDTPQAKACRQIYNSRHDIMTTQDGLPQPGAYDWFWKIVDDVCTKVKNAPFQLFDFLKTQVSALVTATVEKLSQQVVTIAVSVLLAGFVLYYLQTLAPAAAYMFLLLIKSATTATAVVIYNVFASSVGENSEYVEQSWSPFELIQKGICYFIASAAGVGFSIKAITSLAAGSLDLLNKTATPIKKYADLTTSLSKLSHWMQKFIPSAISELMSSGVSKEEWMMSYKKFISEFNQETLARPAHAARLQTAAENLVYSGQTFAEYETQYTTVTNYLGKLKQINEVNNRSAAIWIALYGDPGIGKSVVIPHINQALFDRKDYLGCKRAMNGALHVVNAQAHYWDGYWGQSGVYFDDIGKSLDVKDEPLFFQYIHQATTVGTFPVNQASLYDPITGSKGDKFTSAFIYTTSNTSDQRHITGKFFSNLQSYKRRRNVLVKVRLNPLYNHLYNKGHLDSDGLIEATEGKTNFDHLEFEVLDPLTEKSLTPGSFLNFQGLIDHISLVVSNQYRTFEAISSRMIPTLFVDYNEQALPNTTDASVFYTAKSLSLTYVYSPYEKAVSDAMPLSIAADIVQLSRPYTMSLIMTAWRALNMNKINIDCTNRVLPAYEIIIWHGVVYVSSGTGGNIDTDVFRNLVTVYQEQSKPQESFFVETDDENALAITPVIEKEELPPSTYGTFKPRPDPFVWLIDKIRQHWKACAITATVFISVALVLKTANVFVEQGKGFRGSKKEASGPSGGSEYQKERAAGWNPRRKFIMTQADRDALNDFSHADFDPSYKEHNAVPPETIACSMIGFCTFTTKHKTQTGMCIYPGGSAVLWPKHYCEDMFNDEDLISAHFLLPDSQHTVDIDLRLSDLVTWRDSNDLPMDIYGFILPRSKIPLARHRHNHFAENSAIFKTSQHSQCLLITKSFQNGQSVMTINHARGRVFTKTTLEGDAPERAFCEGNLSTMSTSKGDCGGLMYDASSGKFYGMHVGQYNGTIAKSIPITVEMLRDFVKPEINVVDSNVVTMETGLENAFQDSEEQCLPDLTICHPAFYIGKADPAIRPYLPRENEMKPTIFNTPTHFDPKLYPWGHASKFPVVLSRTSPLTSRVDEETGQPSRQDPILENLKAVRPRKALQPSLVERASSWMKRKYSELMELHPYTPLVLTEKEAINGRPGVSTGVNMTSSDGPIFSKLRPAAKAGKRFWFKEDDKGDLEVGQDILRKYIDEMEEQAALGNRLSNVFVIDYPKSELASGTKFSNKVRLFQIGNIALEILFRRYFGDFLIWFEKLKFDFAHAIGIDVASPDIDMIFKKASTYNIHNITDGDYEAYDKCIPGQINIESIECMIWWYETYGNATSRDSMIRRVLADCIIRCVHLIMDEFYLQPDGVPSGFLLTAANNCNTNWLLLAYVFIEAIQNATYEDWNAVWKWYMGDDNAVGTPQWLSEFFNGDIIREILSRYDIKYTPADKGGTNFIMKTLHSKKWEFVKCTFHRLEDDTWYALQHLSSIDNGIQFTETTDELLRPQYGEFVDGFLSKVFWYGEETFNKYKYAIDYHLAQHDIHCTTKLYAEYFEIYKKKFEGISQLRKFRPAPKVLPSLSKDESYIEQSGTQPVQTSFMEPEEIIQSVNTAMVDAISKDVLTQTVPSDQVNLQNSTISRKFPNNKLTTKHFTPLDDKFYTVQLNATLNPTNTFGEQIFNLSVPYDFYNLNCFLKRIFVAYGVYNFDSVTIRLKFNSTSWQTSMALLSFVPLVPLVQSQDSFPGTNVKRASSLKYSTFIDPNTDPVVEMTIPYAHFHAALRTDGQIDLAPLDNCIGRLILQSVVPVSAVAGATSTVAMTMDVRFNGARFWYQQAICTTAGMKKYIEQGAGTSKVTKTSTYNVVNYILGDNNEPNFSTEEDTSADSSASVDAKATAGSDLDKPSFGMASIPINYQAPSLNQASGSQVTIALAPTHRQSYKPVGIFDKNDTKFSSLLSKWMYLDQLEITPTTPIDTPLWQFPVTPSPTLNYFTPTATSSAIQVTLLDYIAQMFEFWSGPIEFLVSIVGDEGKRFEIQASSSTYTSVEAGEDQISTQGYLRYGYMPSKRSFQITVRNANNRRYFKTYKNNLDDIDIQNLHDYMSTYLSINLTRPLATQTTTSVTVILFVRAPEIKFYNRSPINIIPTTYTQEQKLQRMRDDTESGKTPKDEEKKSDSQLPPPYFQMAKPTAPVSKPKSKFYQEQSFDLDCEVMPSSNGNLNYINDFRTVLKQYYQVAPGIVSATSGNTYSYKISTVMESNEFNIVTSLYSVYAGGLRLSLMHAGIGNVRVFFSSDKTPIPNGLVPARSLEACYKAVLTRFTPHLHLDIPFTAIDNFVWTHELAEADSGLTNSGIVYLVCDESTKFYDYWSTDDSFNLGLCVGPPAVNKVIF